MFMDFNDGKWEIRRSSRLNWYLEVSLNFAEVEEEETEPRPRHVMDV